MISENGKTKECCDNFCADGYRLMTPNESKAYYDLLAVNGTLSDEILQVLNTVRRAKKIASSEKAFSDTARYYAIIVTDMEKVWAQFHTYAENVQPVTMLEE